MTTPTMPADAAEIVRLAEAERDILDCLAAGRKLSLADRREDRCRQRLRKLGYIVYGGTPHRWTLTEAGARARAQHDNEVG